jgi:arylsulfatase
MLRPRNVILLVADSLRYDSVHSGPIGMPYVERRATSYSQARSGGCWTLPATASLFTGMMPHQHGATSQTRGIRKDIPTLGEQMREQGYATAMVTANVATTDIFGLDRGFDELHRIWQTVPAQYKKLHQLLVLAGKPRLRKKIMSKDFVMGKLSEDLDAAKVWLQSTCQDVFAEARRILQDNQRRGQGSFLFLNVMETHFPYHMAPVFRSSPEVGIVDRLRELAALYHLVNQTFLTTGKEHITPDMLEPSRRRSTPSSRSSTPRGTTSWSSPPTTATTSASKAGSTTSRT